MKVDAARFIRSAVSEKDYITDGKAQIAFAGKSNVGKSSLINSLTRVKRIARISSTPGCTRVINYFLINEKFYFVDLPGYGYAKVSKKERLSWRSMIESYLLDNPDLRLLIIIMDVRRTPDDSERDFINWLDSNDIEYAIVVTKVDKISRGALQKQKRRICNALGSGVKESYITAFSAKTGIGRKEVLGLIFDANRSDKE